MTLLWTCLRDPHPSYVGHLRGGYNTMSKSASFWGLANTVTGRIKSWTCQHTSTKQSRQCGLGGVYSSVCRTESWWTSWTRASNMPLWWRTFQNHILDLMKTQAASWGPLLFSSIWDLWVVPGAVSGFGLPSSLECTHLFLKILRFWAVHLVCLNWES